MNYDYNPTLLKLLTHGATVEFPNGVYLKGIPDENYIELGINCSINSLWELTEESLRKAIDSLNFVSKLEE